MGVDSGYITENYAETILTKLNEKLRYFDDAWLKTVAKAMVTEMGTEMGFNYFGLKHKRESDAECNKLIAWDQVDGWMKARYIKFTYLSTEGKMTYDEFKYFIDVAAKTFYLDASVMDFSLGESSLPASVISQGIQLSLPLKSFGLDPVTQAPNTPVVYVEKSTVIWYKNAQGTGTVGFVNKVTGEFENCSLALEEMVVSKVKRLSVAKKGKDKNKSGVLSVLSRSKKSKEDEEETPKKVSALSAKDKSELKCNLKDTKGKTCVLCNEEE